MNDYFLSPSIYWEHLKAEDSRNHQHCITGRSTLSQSEVCFSTYSHPSIKYIHLMWIFLSGLKRSSVDTWMQRHGAPSLSWQNAVYSLMHFVDKEKSSCFSSKEPLSNFAQKNFKQNCFHAWSIFHFMHIIVNILFILWLTKNIFCEQNVTKSMNAQSLNEICILCRKRLNKMHCLQKVFIIIIIILWFSLSQNAFRSLWIVWN